MNKIRRFLNLPYPTKKLYFRSLLLLFLVRSSLWVFPFKWWRKWLTDQECDRIGDKEADWKAIDEVVRAVRLCSRFVPRATCLTQALATRILLRMQSQDAKLRIGVDRVSGNLLTAHAWIEVDGRIVVGKVPRHNRYTVMNKTPLTGL